MATEIAKQEVNGRESVDREDKRVCRNDDEDTGAARQIMMLKDELIFFLS